MSRSHLRPIADLYAFSLPEPIPVFPFPLAPDEPEPAVNLGVLLQGVYDHAGLDLAISYARPPIPPLSEVDRVWAETQLREQGHLA